MALRNPLSSYASSLQIMSIDVTLQTSLVLNTVPRDTLVSSAGSDASINPKRNRYVPRRIFLKYYLYISFMVNAFLY